MPAIITLRHAPKPWVTRASNVSAAHFFTTDACRKRKSTLVGILTPVLLKDSKSRM